MTFAQPRDLSYVPDEQSDLDLVAPHLFCSAALRSNRVALPTGPEAAKIAREFTTQTLREWELDDLVDDAVIIASELVTNAIRHGARRLSHSAGPEHAELAWQRQVSKVMCVVTDESARPPVLTPSEVDAECGRGLQVVQALAAAWGWTMLGPAQKAVWATLEFMIGA